MDFIGRTSELATLNAELERGSGFVVIYGRRRVGKTTLIKEFIKDKRAFYFLATTESEAQSMKRFAGVLSRTTKNPMLSKVTFTDWLDLFQVVTDDHPDEKKVLVIDEFPYLVKTNPDFPSILQNAWDEVLKDHNVMLVLCGSLISMMKKHALAYDSPLYGRRTAQIRLMPLQFTDVYEAQNLSFEQAVEQYAITGGVPKYMEFFQTDEPLVEQIRRVVLSKNGFLYEEPDFLLNEEVQTPINYFSVLKAISDGNHKLSKIGMTMEQDTSAITPYLKTLIDLGIAKKETPITEKPGKKTIYLLADNFFRFWYRFVPINMSAIDSGRIAKTYPHAVKQYLPDYMGLIYEKMCQDYLLYYSDSLPIELSEIGQWWGTDPKKKKQIQIDIVGTPVEGKDYIIGSCKYRNEKIGVDELDLIRDYASVFGKGNNYHYYIFSKGGFTDGLLQAQERGEVRLITLEDLYK